MSKHIIFHVDVNSAYLSWESAFRISKGNAIDLRKIPAIIGGNKENRHGIVLAASIPAKKHNIITGESIFNAQKKCPNLKIVPPNRELYKTYSNKLMNLLGEYTPKVEQFSIDECFLDLSNMDNIYSDYINLANTIRNRIYTELGFTVNIGISSNRVLAKMASDFEKPNKIHTLFTNELKDKLWPLDIENLYMVGKVTAPKLRQLNINTIGDIAKYDPDILKYKFKSLGITLWEYANGIEKGKLTEHKNSNYKSIGNETTTASDIYTRNEAHEILLCIAEKVSKRLRNQEELSCLITVKYKTTSFTSQTHQRLLELPTDSTSIIYEESIKLFNEMWTGEPIRLIGITLGKLSPNSIQQCSFFETTKFNKNKALDSTLDSIRKKYGSTSVNRGSLINSDYNNILD